MSVEPSFGGGVVGVDVLERVEEVDDLPRLLPERTTIFHVKLDQLS